jgi:hypothetical protein
MSSTHLLLRCSNFFNPSKENSFGCAANHPSAANVAPLPAFERNGYVCLKIAAKGRELRVYLHYCSAVVGCFEKGS